MMYFITHKSIIISCLPLFPGVGQSLLLGVPHNLPVPFLDELHHRLVDCYLVVVDCLDGGCGLFLWGSNPDGSGMWVGHLLDDGHVQLSYCFWFAEDVIDGCCDFLLDACGQLVTIVWVDEDFGEVEDGGRDGYFGLPTDAQLVDLVLGYVALQLERLGNAFAHRVLHINSYNQLTLSNIKEHHLPHQTQQDAYWFRLI